MNAKLLPVCLLAAVTTHAQPTITHANNNFLAGYSSTAYYVTAVPQGASGANVTWDFSGIGTSAGVTGTYAACSSSNNCSTFPGSNVVVQSSGSATKSYFIVDNTRYALNGTANASGTNIIFTNPEDMQRYPFTYNNTYTDNFAASYVSGGATINRSGSITVTADGYGTLKLPNGTFNNVLRIKRLETYADSWGGTGMNYTVETYAWYSPVMRELLLTRIEASMNGSPVPVVMAYTSQTPSAVTSMVIAAGSTLLYPNPARDLVQVQFEATRQTTASIMLMDITGRQVLETQTLRTISGRNEAKLSTGQLSPGMYLMQLEADGQVVTKKVQVL